MKTKEEDVMYAQEAPATPKTKLSDTSTPGIFRDEETGTLFVLETDYMGKRYLSQLNNQD